MVYFLRVLTYSIVACVGYIVIDIIWNGLPVLNWEFVSSFPRRGGSEGGIFPAIVGTLCLVGGTISLAFPLGVSCAIYLSEYSKPGKFLNAMRLAIITLAGIPSIVFGLFGLGVFVLFLNLGSSILAGSLTLACMILPTIIVVSEEALRAVPQTFREGSLALGATKWQTISRNILPCALPGMITGTLLWVGRSAGETAPILLTVAAFYLPRLPHSIFDQVMALPYHLYVLATQHPDIEKVRPLQYGTALVLLLLVLGLNGLAIFLRRKFRKKHAW
ncbi:MAG: phosphate ABC transporter permease PstA [Candidatus Hydrogenedentes bacterium]|nr:phosphate ABC transporter permease PstA [Candidatus Hydrogenedentota bacterium]